MGKVGGGRKQWVFCFCADVLFRVLFNRPELLLIRLPLPRALGGGGGHARAQGGGQRGALPPTLHNGERRRRVKTIGRQVLSFRTQSLGNFAGYCSECNASLLFLVIFQDNGCVCV
jgi:hypothetical protein